MMNNTKCCTPTQTITRPITKFTHLPLSTAPSVAAAAREKDTRRPDPRHDDLPTLYTGVWRGLGVGNVRYICVYGAADMQHGARRCKSGPCAGICCSMVMVLEEMC